MITFKRFFTTLRWLKYRESNHFAIFELHKKITGIFNLLKGMRLVILLIKLDFLMHIKFKVMKTTFLALTLFCIALVAKSEVASKSNETLKRNPGFIYQPKDEAVISSKDKNWLKLKLVGNLYIAPENWSKVGMSDDSKIGLGLGGMLGLGLKIDDMIIGVGPHIGINRWEANYSKKAQSATSSVFYELMDTGIEGVFVMNFGKSKMAIILGKGKTDISSGYVVGGQTIPYPETDNKTEDYTNVGIAFYLGKIQIAPNYVSYTGVIKDAERLEIRLGFAF